MQILLFILNHLYLKSTLGSQSMGGLGKVLPFFRNSY